MRKTKIIKIWIDSLFKIDMDKLMSFSFVLESQRRLSSCAFTSSFEEEASAGRSTGCVYGLLIRRSQDYVDALQRDNRPIDYFPDKSLSSVRLPFIILSGLITTCFSWFYSPIDLFLSSSSPSCKFDEAKKKIKMRVCTLVVSTLTSR